MNGAWRTAAVLGPALWSALATGPAMGQLYPLSPQWQSADRQISTGAALVDLDRDGWLDLVVANGNDISRQRVVVYYGTGAGTLETAPSWQSTDLAYNGHLDVADVDGDGWMDVAVGELLSSGSHSAKLYRNIGGVLTTTAVWSTPDLGDTFGVAFGDVNGDGRPDLALATGAAYSGTPFLNRVYINQEGSLPAAASWTTAEPRNFMSALWVDADRDGDLDLCYTGADTDTFIYRNAGGALEATPYWRTNDSRRQFALMAAAGDVTGDGLRDLLIADNNQLFGGSGRFRRYDGLAAGAYNPVASWTYSDGYTSAVALGDLDQDGVLDLVTGEWFGRSRYFLNSGAGLPATPAWTSGGSTSTVEKLVLGDIDRNGRRTGVIEYGPGPGKVVDLPRQPVETILSVELDGVELAPSRYTFNREQAWLAVDAAPAASLRVVYLYSLSLDLAVSNWDDTRPNYVYFNQRVVACLADLVEDGTVDFIDYLEFLNFYDAADPRADFNFDGQVDFADYLEFLNLYDGGC
ncbi:MAG: VCBS repeat-containing protein [Phycisphaerales bacterium]|nr:VCBS repeat-containing protein [Phycisphaerales bacterium]